MMRRDPSETTTGTAEKMWVVIGRLARRRRRRATWQVHIRSSHGVICNDRVGASTDHQSISQTTQKKRERDLALTAAKEHARSL